MSKLDLGGKCLNQRCINQQYMDHADLNHVKDWNEAKVVGKNSDKFKRWIKEAIAIRKEPKTMNRDEGQYNLNHMFEELLMEDRIGNTVARQRSTTPDRKSSLHH